MGFIIGETNREAKRQAGPKRIGCLSLRFAGRPVSGDMDIHEPK
jgi:hypothetical protein